MSMSMRQSRSRSRSGSGSRSRSGSRVAGGASAVLTLLAVLTMIFTSYTNNCLIVGVEAAHSRRRTTSTGRGGSPGSARYDRSITTFDNSGRLLQVEYGMEAASRGATVAAVWTEGGTYVLVKSSDNTNKVHRIDEHLWLFTAGLSGDASALAASLRSSCQQHRLSYGEASTVEQAAKHCASLQHQLTRTGGARPLGCTAIVVGTDPTTSTAATGTGKSRVFRSDPGGILEDCLYTVAGKDHEHVMVELAKRYNGLSKESQTAANESTVVTEMVAAINSLVGSGGGGNSNDSGDRDSSVDIWIFQPNTKRRGKTHATRLRNVKRDNLQSVVALLDNRREEKTI